MNRQTLQYRSIFFALFLLPLFAGCGSSSGGSASTLVLTSSQFNGVFSPFFATTAFDSDVTGLTQATLLTNDRQGMPADGIAAYVPPRVITAQDGKTRSVYTFTLEDGAVFSDGKPVTADDIIFTYKVYCDPTYDGAATIYSTPILGVEAYRASGPEEADIEGIKKIDGRTVEVTIEGVDPKAIWNLGGISPVPAHYYGTGFKKGDLAAIRAKNSQPLGAGPFIFEKYENNVVSLKRNPRYYKGEPHIEKIKYQVSSNVNKLEAVKLGQADIADPNPSPEMVELSKEAGMHVELIDNLGYAYIGINAERVSDKNVRKGLMHLMNREPAVHTYFGDLATVIERPMSKISWAYPQETRAVYPFSPEKALTYFLKAGYRQVTDGSKTMLMKDGKQLRLEIGIGGEGNMDHPAAPILTQLKQELEKLGGVLDINDCDANVLFDRLNTNQWDMWVAAWQATIDPDMYQIYYSQGPSNHYRVNNAELDRLVVEARQTLDIGERQKKYFRALDIIMDEAVEMPTYQRKNMFIFNPQAIDIASLPENMSAYYTYGSEIEKLRMAVK